MQEILDRLQELDRLYTSDTLETYERQWQETVEKIEHLYPGFTLAYAEIYTQGQDRTATGNMRHCLIPRERNTR